jgi:hypothetical protein
LSGVPAELNKRGSVRERGGGAGVCPRHNPAGAGKGCKLRNCRLQLQKQPVVALEAAQAIGRHIWHQRQVVLQTDAAGKLKRLKG